MCDDEGRHWSIWSVNPGKPRIAVFQKLGERHGTDCPEDSLRLSVELLQTEQSSATPLSQMFNL